MSDAFFWSNQLYTQLRLEQPGNFRINDLVIGDNYRIEAEIYLSRQALENNDSVTQASLYIKKNPEEADVNSEVALTITSTATAHGQITNTGQGGLLALKFNLLPADTSLLDASYKYFYKVTYFTTSGLQQTPYYGVVYPVQK